MVKKRKLTRKSLNGHDLKTDGRCCPGCNEPLTRADDEDWTAFKRRKYCSSTCQEVVRRGENKAAKRKCAYCGGLIPRRRNKRTGKLEYWSNYKKRRYCGQRCELAHTREINEAEQQRHNHVPAVSGGEDPNSATGTKTMQQPTTQALPVQHNAGPQTVGDSVPHVKKLARSYTVDAVNALVQCLTQGSGSTRVAAAKELLERGWGKAMQQHDHVVRRADEMSEEELMAFLGIKEDEHGNFIEVEEYSVLPNSEQSAEPTAEPPQAKNKNGQ